MEHNAKHILLNIYKFFKWAFFCVGLLLAILAAVLYVRKSRELDRLPTVEALILETQGGEANVYTLVEYEVGGQSYVHRFPSYSSERKAGDRMTIAYNGDYPNEAYEIGAESYVGALIAAIFSGVAFWIWFLAWGLGWLFKRLIRKQNAPVNQKDPWER